MSNKLSFPQVKLSIESGLASPGDTISVQDTIDVDAFSIGGRDLKVSDGISYDIVLTNTGDGILATGMARFEADTAITERRFGRLPFAFLRGGNAARPHAALDALVFAARHELRVLHELFVHFSTRIIGFIWRDDDGVGILKRL